VSAGIYSYVTRKISRNKSKIAPFAKKENTAVEEMKIIELIP
jgi:hypothetical protein